MTPQYTEHEMFFRHTDTHLGRYLAVTPINSAMRHLAYGRVILNPSQPSVNFDTGERETVLVCLKGEARVTAGTETFSLGRLDSLYIPRDRTVDVATALFVDFAEFSAEVEGHYALQLVRAAEITEESGLKFVTGEPGSTRAVSMLVTKNVKAGRLMVGVTTSEAGNWTSWPPHEHARMLEEMYVYFDMPAPAFGVQLVYNNTEYPEWVTVVRQGDAVMMPEGYHPNVAVPGHQLTFLWAMAAHREVEDRQYGVVNVQPDFSQVSLNLQGRAAE